MSINLVLEHLITIMLKIFKTVRYSCGSYYTFEYSIITFFHNVNTILIESFTITPVINIMNSKMMFSNNQI